MRRKSTDMPRIKSIIFPNARKSSSCAIEVCVCLNGVWIVFEYYDNSFRTSAFSLPIAPYSVCAVCVAKPLLSNHHSLLVLPKHLRCRPRVRQWDCRFLSCREKRQTLCENLSPRFKKRRNSVNDLWVSQFWFLSLSAQNLEKTGLYQLRTEQRYQNITTSFASEDWEKR